MDLKNVLCNVDPNWRKLHRWIPPVCLEDHVIFHLGTSMPLACEDPPSFALPPFHGGGTRSFHFSMHPVLVRFATASNEAPVVSESRKSRSAAIARRARAVAHVVENDACARAPQRIDLSFGRVPAADEAEHRHARRPRRRDARHAVLDHEAMRRRDRAACATPRDTRRARASGSRPCRRRSAARRRSARGPCASAPVSTYGEKLLLAHALRTGIAASASAMPSTGGAPTAAASTARRIASICAASMRAGRACRRCSRAPLRCAVRGAASRPARHRHPATARAVPRRARAPRRLRCRSTRRRSRRSPGGRRSLPGLGRG